jgi:hypothetical protein
LRITEGIFPRRRVCRKEIPDLPTLPSGPRRRINARVSPGAEAAAVMITCEQIEARKRRLEKLAKGFMREVVVTDEHDDPFLRVERVAYQKALRQAIAGCETARVVLAHATQRNAREGRQG